MARNTTAAQNAQETPELKVPENADQKLDQEAAKLEKQVEETQGNAGIQEMMRAMMELKNQIAGLQKDLDAQKKENEELKKNSVYSPSPYGSKTDRERVYDACVAAEKAGLDPWTVKISVLAPRIGKGEDSYWLSTNGKNMAVPADDRYYDLALPFAESMVNEISARKRAADMIDKLEVYDPVNNPHPVEKIV